MFEIIIWRQGEPSSFHRFPDYATARNFYRLEALRWDRYTQLLVCGMPYTTAQAERFFQLGTPLGRRLAQ